MVVAAPLLIALIALAAPAELRADGEQQAVVGWLEKMSEAVHKLSYQGTIVYLHGSQLETMQVVHTVQGGQERERLTSLNGEPREVVLDSDSITCVSPHAKLISVDKRPARLGLPSLLPGRFDELGGYYDFHMETSARVADRVTQVISITPRDVFRYGYRMHLDQESGLPLKTDTLSAGGNLVAQIMYTQVRIDPALAHSASAPRFNSAGFTQRHPPAPAIRPVQHGAGHWVFGDLPAGFRPSIHDLRKEADGSALEHFVLSDGLASISVYIERQDGDEEAGEAHEFLGPATIGAINAYGQQVAGHQVTVVGEVPATTAQRVAEGIRFSTESPDP